MYPCARAEETSESKAAEERPNIFYFALKERIKREWIDWIELKIFLRKRRGNLATSLCETHFKFIDPEREHSLSDFNLK